MKRTIYLSIMFLGLAIISFAQETKDGRIERADKHFDNFSFNKAIIKYKESGDNSIASLRKLGHSYYKTHQFNKAEETFASIVNDTSATSEDVFHYAAILEINEKYCDAKQWMEIFAQQKPNDQRTVSFNKNKDYKFFLEDKGQFSVSNLNFNTGHQDFGPAYYHDELVFASTRTNLRHIKREWNWNELPFLSLYKVGYKKDVSENKTDIWDKAKPFIKKMNKKYHDGPVSFNADYTQLFLTRNNYENASEEGIIKLQLFTSKLVDNEWSELESFPYNSSEYSVAHASLSQDGKFLFFASDMPGGFGAADIYKVEVREDGTYGEAINLGDQINTESNEMFPFIHKSGMFFFASDGLAGLGGLDLFYTKMKGDNSFTDVHNLGYPMNSNRDDFALVLNDEATDGYFSSNRNGGKGDDDIYSFQMLPFKFKKLLRGTSLTKTRDTIPNAKVILFSEKGIKIDSVMSSNKGGYEFVVEADQLYALLGKKEQFFDGHNKADTHTDDEVIIADLVLLQDIKVLAEIVQINPIFFDFDKFNIRLDAAIELDKIVEVMNKYEHLVVELGSHTDCRGSKAYNERLSDNRAKASVQYIKERITNPERIYGKGYGEYRLLNSCECEGSLKSNCSKEAHQLNRRTEFRVIKTGTNGVKVESNSPDSF